MDVDYTAVKRMVETESPSARADYPEMRMMKDRIWSPGKRSLGAPSTLNHRQILPSLIILE